jgi:hypothetical protein
MVNESRLPAILTTIINTKQTYIPVLIASTGSNLEAVMAGSIPEIRPNNVLKNEYILLKQIQNPIRSNINAIIQTKTIRLPITTGITFK